MGCLPEFGKKGQKEGDALASICRTFLEAGQVPVDRRTNVAPMCVYIPVCVYIYITAALGKIKEIKHQSAWFQQWERYWKH